MTWCLLPKYVDAIKQIDVRKLAKMTSEERHAFLRDMVGEESAHQVNAHLESRLLLKNEKLAMENWAKKLIKKQDIDTKRDVLSKIQKMDKRILDPATRDAFLSDLAEKKMGTKVSFEDVKKITEYSNKLTSLKEKITDKTPERSMDRLEYGAMLETLNRYVQDLKVKGEAIPFKDYWKHPGEALYQIAGTAKSMLSSLDNSFFGRQGIKTLFTNPAIWSKSFIKSWGDITGTISGKDTMLALKADIYSRPNAMNGRYKAAKLDIGITGEEAFPTSIPSRIPVIGRFFHAAENAYNGAAVRIRADLFDKFIKKAEEQGVDLNSKLELESMGKLVNSMTGRGGLGSFEAVGRQVNAVFFSAKFLKSNFDTLTAHVLDKNMSRFAKKQAAMNLVKIVGTTAGVLTMAEMLNPGSVEKDPRSSNFGKIRIGEGQWVDITGGMASIVTLASRFITRSRIDSKGNVIRTDEGKYGIRDTWDAVMDFMSGKLSPMMGLVRDYGRGHTYQGEKVTPLTSVKNLFTPLPIKNIEQLKDPMSADGLADIILEGLGFNVSQPYRKPKRELRKF